MTTTPLQPTDFAVIIGYFALMIAIGVYFRQFMKQVKDYFTAQNQVPWWLAGVSHYMSSFSALTFVMYAEIAYLYGWVAVTICWVAVPACFVAGTWIAPRWRRARALTPVEFLERLEGGSEPLLAYDMLERRALDVSRAKDAFTFKVDLDALAHGG